jgi:hypothetical protein
MSGNPHPFATITHTNWRIRTLLIEADRQRMARLAQESARRPRYAPSPQFLSLCALTGGDAVAVVTPALTPTPLPSVTGEGLLPGNGGGRGDQRHLPPSGHGE